MANNFAVSVLQSAEEFNGGLFDPQPEFMPLWGAGITGAGQVADPTQRGSHAITK